MLTRRVSLPGCSPWNVRWGTGMTTGNQGMAGPRPLDSTESNTEIPAASSCSPLPALQTVPTGPGNSKRRERSRLLASAAGRASPGAGPLGEQAGHQDARLQVHTRPGGECCVVQMLLAWAKVYDHSRIRKRCGASNVSYVVAERGIS